MSRCFQSADLLLPKNEFEKWDLFEIVSVRGLGYKAVIKSEKE